MDSLPDSKHIGSSLTAILRKKFSKFDMKSKFWQILIHPLDRYKTAFTVPFEHYEWNVMPFGLKMPLQSSREL